MEGGSPSFERARRLTGQCRYRAARRACEVGLKEDPDNVRIVALKLRLDVVLHRTTIGAARALLAELIQQNPDNTYLKVAAALLFQVEGDRPTAIVELRSLAEQHMDDSYVHQVLAGLLGCDEETREDAWWHYKVALQAGPLMTPAYKGAAYALGKRIEPERAETALQGSGSIEKASIRTRALGFNALGMVLAVPLIPTFILIALHQTGWGFAALGVASLAAGWIAYSNAAAGCWKCLAYWALITSIGWGVVALGQWSRSGNWRWLYVGAAVGLILALVVPKKSAASSSEDKTGTARSSLTKRTLAPLAVLGGFILVIALSTHSTNPLSPVESDCTSAPAITGAVGDDNTRIEAVGIFKSGTTESQAESYESSFASMNSGCFSLAEITTTTSGLKVMSVRELPSVIRYTQPHVLKSLISSGLFSSVTK